MGEHNKTGFLHMRIHQAFKEDLKRLASARGMKLSTWVDQALRKAAEEQRRR